MWPEALCLRTQKVVLLRAGKEARYGRGSRQGRRRPSEPLLSAEEVAEYYGVGQATIYRWCREGRISCLKIGKHWRVRRVELVDFLKEVEDSKGA